MTSPSPFMVMHSMTTDRSALDGKELTKQTRRRVMAFARPYRGSIIGFLGTIIAATFLGLLPPLLIREIFDDAIVDGDGGYLNILFLFMIAAALGEAVLGLVERYLSSRIGEGLVAEIESQFFANADDDPLGRDLQDDSFVRFKLTYFW